MILQLEINIQESSINEKSNNIMPFMLCAVATLTPGQSLDQFHLMLQVCIYLLFVFYSHTRPKILALVSVTLQVRNQRGKGREVSIALFLKQEKSALIFGGNALMAGIYHLISQFKCNFQKFSGKKLKIYPFRAFIFSIVDRSALTPRKIPCPKKVLVTRLRYLALMLWWLCGNVQTAQHEA